MMKVLRRPRHSTFISLQNCTSAGGYRVLPPPPWAKISLSPSRKAGTRGTPPTASLSPSGTCERGEGEGPQNLEPTHLQGRAGGFNSGGQDRNVTLDFHIK